MSVTVMKYSSPAWPLALTEGARALGELPLLPAAEFVLKLAPKGDGHPVIVCPGFLTGDGSTGLLRRFLRSKNYRVYGWNLGRNLGPGETGEKFEQLAAHVEAVTDEYGEPVSLVGWSLGGVMAREIAKQDPDRVRQVITLGSPLSGNSQNTSISWLYNQVAGDPALVQHYRELIENLHLPPEKVPSTAIFTRGDGIVHWRSSLEPRAAFTDNIEVYSSHCGLGISPFVYFAIADRLMQSADDWAPFDRNASAWRKVAYPSAGHVYDR
ncbi:MAG: alpha/beta fold hydrolase [Pseudomonadota bacterium]